MVLTAVHTCRKWELRLPDSSDSSLFFPLGLKAARKNGNKESFHELRSTAAPVEPEENTAAINRTVPTTTAKIAAHKEVNAVTDAPPPRKALRLTKMSHSERKCCKLGQRASRKGYFCNLDLFYSSRFTNMEHNMKMKFQVRPVSPRARKFVHHIDRWCVKTGLKRFFYKCCETA